MTPQPPDTERTLLEWLLQQHPDTPRKRAKQWILAGRVTVNGAVLRQPHLRLPDPGDGLRLRDRQTTTLDCGTAGLVIHPRLTLLHLDGAIAIVNKGPGLLSVSADPSDLSAQSLLADYLAGKLRPPGRTGKPSSVPAAYRGLQPLPVHRLDKLTSGLFCLAMNPQARETLVDQARRHTMTREYVAYVEGCPDRPTGTWRNWLKLSADEWVQTVVGHKEPDAIEAITHYQILTADKRSGVTKLHVRLETGCRHQIRVQAAHAGFPLVGDRTYNPAYRAGHQRGPRQPFPRQALHAIRLSLTPPGAPGQRHTWTAPLPRDLRELEARLREQGSRLRSPASDC